MQHARRRFVIGQVFVLLGLCVLTSARGWATSLSPTQLRGLEGVNLHVYVSRQLESTSRLLEDRIRDEGGAILQDGDIIIRSSASHLSVDVEVTPSDYKSTNGEQIVAMRVAVRLREPVKLVRNKRILVPGGGAVIWEDSITDVTTESEISRLIMDYSHELLQRFVEAVEVVRR